LNNKIAINGWKDLSILNLNEFLEKYLKKGISRVICTDINKDGMLEGPSFELYLKILNNFSNIKLIASGGVSVYNDLIKLNEIGCEGCIIGKAIYEDKITLNQLEKFIISYTC